MSTQVQAATAEGTAAADRTAAELADERQRRENTMLLAVGGLAAAGLGVALLSMLMNNQRGMIVVRM
ncbi:hypothetical protein [Streptomyces sp. x-19]|uniref:hypothetical protein n=1 Tax=Streptomyces sp. x-19 TaxID=2789280 RepID=UPI0039802245